MLAFGEGTRLSALTRQNGVPALLRSANGQECPCSFQSPARANLRAFRALFPTASLRGPAGLKEASYSCSPSLNGGLGFGQF